MIRSFAGAFLWLLALWSVGAWLEALVGLPEQFGLLAGLVVAGLLIGHGLRLAFAGRVTTATRAPVTAD
jgi:hypothetical protein